MARQHARRQRRERVVGATIAVLGIAVLLVAIFALRNPRKGNGSAASGHAGATRTITSAVSTPAPKTAESSPKPKGSTTSVHLGSTPASGRSTKAKAVPLIVLNNTTTPNLAKQAAQRFESGGWSVTHYGNLNNEIVSTCAYYDPSDDSARPAAEALQRQYPTIKRVEPKFPELPDGPVVVVLTPDYSSE